MEISEIIENMNFDAQCEGCGLEDSGITDRYEAMEYGFNIAVQMVQELSE